MRLTSFLQHPLCTITLLPVWFLTELLHSNTHLILVPCLETLCSFTSSAGAFKTLPNLHPTPHQAYLWSPHMPRASPAAIPGALQIHQWPVQDFRHSRGHEHPTSISSFQAQFRGHLLGGACTAPPPTNKSLTPGFHSVLHRTINTSHFTMRPGGEVLATLSPQRSSHNPRRSPQCPSHNPCR